MLQNIVDVQILQAGMTGSSNYGTAYEMSRFATFSMQATLAVSTPSAVVVPSSDISVANDTFTKTAHGLLTGLKGQFTTSSALPTGISAATDYFIIVVDDNTFKVATTYNNAVAGTAVNITGAGTGNQTFTPTALAGGEFCYQISNDGVTYNDYGTPVAVTAATTQWFLSSATPSFKYIRTRTTLTAGSLGLTNNVYGRGYGDY